jgi:galactose-1-phosphate uridylyltransferase
MPAIMFEERELAAMVPDPAAGGVFTPIRLRWRRDPLTAASCRILTGVKLQPAIRPDLTALIAPPAFCPFDADKLEQTTFPFPPELSDEGRIRCGKAVVVPNLLAYANHSAVGIYDPATHFLDLDELSGELIGDALAALVRHARAVRRLDPSSAWSSINANYLPPAGSSLVHPHAQSAHDSCGTSVQRALVERSAAWAGPGSYWRALVEEEQGGPRWLGTTGRVAWLTPFAPIGFHEVMGVVAGSADIVDLTEDDTAAIGKGLSRVLAAYRHANLTSFNFAIIGGGPDGEASRYEVVIRIVSRASAEPMYRSDATYFERLHAEAMIDLSPEEIADLVRAEPVTP